MQVRSGRERESAYVQNSARDPLCLKVRILGGIVLIYNIPPENGELLVYSFSLTSPPVNGDEMQSTTPRFNENVSDIKQVSMIKSVLTRR